MKDPLFNKFLSIIYNGYSPKGRSDNGGRWYPHDTEHCSCCEYIRSPSRSYPYSLYHHCKSKKHIKQVLLNRYKVSCSEDLPLLINEGDFLGMAAKSVLQESS